MRGRTIAVALLYLIVMTLSGPAVAQATMEACRASLENYVLDADGVATNAEAQLMLMDMGAEIVSQLGPDAFVGLCNPSWEFAVFVGSYGQPNCYGIRYGDPDHSYFGSNATYFERCEAAPAVDRFVDNANGTVTDTLTDLVWLKDADCLGPLSWTDSTTAAAQLADGQCGLTDGSSAGEWRLPSLGCPSGDVCFAADATGEFATILAPSCPYPFILDTAGTGCWSQGDPFTGFQMPGYWSSSSYTPAPSNAWYPFLLDGFVRIGGKQYNQGAWAVRDESAPNVTLYTDRTAFDLSAANLQIIDFEGIAAAGEFAGFYGGLTLKNVSFLASNPSNPGFFNMSVVNPGAGLGSYDSGSGAVLTVQPGAAVTEITLPAGVTSFGLDVMTRAGYTPVPVSCTFSNGEVFNIQQLPFPGHQFVGFTSDVAISSIRITAGTGNAADYDNFVFGQRATQQSSDQVIETIAGNFDANGFLATELPLFPTGGILVEPDGDLLVQGYTQLYRIDAATDVVARIGGIRSASSAGDGGPASLASWVSFFSHALDGAGNIYLSDGNSHKVRRIAPDLTITTVAGNGTPGYSGDGGPATGAQLTSPGGLALNAAGALFIADEGTQSVRKVDTNGTVSTVAGTGFCGCSGDGGPATAALLCQPSDVDFDSAGNMYIADSGCSTIRKVDTSGTITTVAGTPDSFGFSGDGGPATNAQLFFPLAIALDSGDDLYIADAINYRIRRVSGGVIDTVAGSGTPGFSGDGGPATSASLSQVWGLQVDNSDRLLIADSTNRRLRRIDAGIIEAIAGRGDNFFGEGQAAIASSMSLSGLALNPAGELVTAEGTNQRIRKIDAAGVITTIAGTGVRGSAGDGGPATAAELSGPSDVVFHTDGTMFIVDRGNNKIRRVDGPTGVITTYAGTGASGFSGDGGPAANARLRIPAALALAPDGTLYIVDERNQRIRRVTPGGIIDTYAGNGAAGYSGDGGPATTAELAHPAGVALDAEGNLYIADKGNDCIRKVDTGGTITTFLGVGAPERISTHPDGSLLITADNVVFKSDLTGPLVEIIAGDGIHGYSGDGGPAAGARLSFPSAAVADADGNIFIADAGNMRIRKVFTYAVAASSIPLPTVSETAAGLAGGSTTGASVAGTGDLNNDGLDDFIAGAPGYQDAGGPSEVGAAAVYLGSTVEADRATPDIIFIGEQANDRAGVSVESNVDFNGDGVNDLLIGAEQVDRTNPANPVPVGSGKTYLIYFDPTDLVHYPNLANPALEDRVHLALVGQPGGIPGVVFVGGMPGDQAGFDVAAGAGVGAGGGTEIAIGAPGRDTAAGVDAGTVYLIFNDPSLSGVIDLSRVANGQADEIAGVVYEGAAAGDGLGYAVAFPGDVDDAAGADLAMGAPFADPTPGGLEANRTDAGIVYVASGGDVLRAIVEVDQIGTHVAGMRIVGTQSGENLGSALDGGGDALVNGHADLLIGAPGYDTAIAVDAGRVFHSAGPLPRAIIEVDQIGNTGGSPTAIDGKQYIGTNEGDRLGTAVAGLGDVTGDLIDDVAFSAPFADPDGLTDAGIIYVVEGQEFTLRAIIEVDQIGTGVPGRQLTGRQPGELAGSALDAAGDLNGDATRDFLAGSPGTDATGEDDTGAVSMVLETTHLAAGQPPLGEPPVADAGEDQLLDCQSGLSATTMLDGSGSTDPDDDIVSYEWLENGIPTASDVMPTVVFTLGTHDVTLTVTDSTDQSDSDDVTITVGDMTAPAIVCPADMIVECTSGLQAQVTLAPATAADGCGNGATITNSYTVGGADASGAYPLGLTTVVFTAVDDAGNAAQCSIDVTVEDTVPPVVTVMADPQSLWPPNHRLHDVHYGVAVVEACDPSPLIQLDSIASSEADDALGDLDGATTADIQDAAIGTADFDVMLRAERHGYGPGRTYTAVFHATDAAGNVGQGTDGTYVPHDQGGGAAEPIDLRVDDSAGSTVTWGAANGAIEYDVIRGDLHALIDSGDEYVLGAVTCVEHASGDTSTVGDEDAANPEQGRVFFYLVQSVGNERRSGYGTLSAAKDRAPSSGDCR